MALLKELCYGTCRWYFQLNNTLGTLLDKPLKSKDCDIHCLLILGMYQLSHMRIPEYVSINETVNACVVLKKPWAKGLINAVLRKFQRLVSADEIPYPDDAARFSYPDWLVNLLKTEWPDSWEEIPVGAWFGGVTQTMNWAMRVGCWREDVMSWARPGELCVMGRAGSGSDESERVRGWMARGSPPRSS
jgi:hypothetical protein